MRRVIQTPRTNMVPMMGLCAVLICLLVAAAESPIAVIDAGLPSI